MSNLIDWPFLNEPLWRWALMVGALLLILWGWKGVIAIAKEA